jgi:hypothetical protein
MSEYSRRIIPVVVVTLLVTTIAAYEVNNLYSPTSSTSQTSETRLGSNLGSSGLQLFVSLNASQLTPGQTLQVNVSVFNTLSTNNRLPVMDGFPFKGIPFDLWPDCDLVWLGSPNAGFNASAPAEAVVLKGDYTMSNITSVADKNVIVNGCTLGEMTVEQVTFQAGSGQANLTGPPGLGQLGPNETVGPYRVAGAFTTNGYWKPGEFGFLNYEGQQTIDSPVMTPFTPGVYTVGIEDIWGQAVILHFVVK